jgi:hypothetical protein
VLQHLLNAQSFVRVFREHAAYKIDHTGRASVPTRRFERNRCSQNGLVCLGHAITSERHLTGDKIEENYAEGPHVCPLVIEAVFAKLLRRHVSYRSAKSLKPLTWPEDDGFAEVSQLEVIDEAVLINRDQNVI